MTADNGVRWTDPNTWPWIVWLWLLLVLVGWAKPAWRWFQRRRAASWPSASGRVESVVVTGPGHFKGRSPVHTADIAYSYSVEGQYYGGCEKREFRSEQEASEFVRDLHGKPVSIQYNPNKHSTSALSASSLETLLQTRAPAPQSTASTATANTVPQWAKPFLWILTALAAVGLVLSLWVHLGAVFDNRVIPQELFFGLHAGIFVVWLPTVLVAKRRFGAGNGKDYWTVVLNGAPGWMRYMVYGFFAYALVNFAYFMMRAPGRGQQPNPPSIVTRGFSGHWMLFYAVALATLYAACNSSDEPSR